MTKTKGYIALALGALLAVSSAAPAFAAENDSRGNDQGLRRGAPRADMMRRASSTLPRRAPEGNPGGVMDFGKDGGPITSGKVLSISGSTFTMESIAVRRSTTTRAIATSTVRFTVDATNATIVKDRATSTFASIAVGDAVVVKGKVTSGSIAAKAIMDVGTAGMPTRPGMMRGDGLGHGSTTASSTWARPNGDDHRPAPAKTGFFNRVMNFFGSWFR